MHTEGSHSICKKTSPGRFSLISSVTQLESYYHLSYTIVSLVFLSPLVGYTVAALLNHRIHSTFGQRGVAIIAPLSHLIAYVISCVHPPYPVLVVAYIFAGLGNGLEDAGWNAWIGNMANANELLGLLHGFYGAGAVLSPLIATSMIARGNMPWYYFYYVMVSEHIPMTDVPGLIVRWHVRWSSYWCVEHAFGMRELPTSSQPTYNPPKRTDKAG